ncbi:unnamed protein product [Phytophthora fragariaefolia]|uniref:Unnamed protein product n=1 Tax=Phytophthora fragariaefolia TaxID=1490495 RepID=A0A9W7D3Y6_9STRA|nr:unnamed protein product [Phytophthora fragariaefolia]
MGYLNYFSRFALLCYELGLARCCKEVGVSTVNEAAGTAETTDDGVAVHGRVIHKANGRRGRQDRQCDAIWTSGVLDPASAASPANSSSLTNRSANEQADRLTLLNWPANEQPGNALGSECETIGRKADEVWLDATTDSVDDYTAVDDGGVTDRKYVASESLGGCDE